MRALLSVTDKSGIVEFARGLEGLGFELISTGGTANVLREAGMIVYDVSQVTGFPEMMDGRLKTLHPFVHGGLLGDRREEKHRRAMADAGIEAIHVLCVNLYAFEKTVTNPHTFEEAIEAIDIGGPAMIRAAAKNHPNVYVIVDPADYPLVISDLQSPVDGFKRKLAAKAFRHTAFYDSMIARYMTEASGEDELTPTLTLGYRRTIAFRYGENPHQSGALYQDPLAEPGIAQAVQLWGKDLSYNNLNDADGAWELVADLPEGSCAIIKHGNPCGAAHGSTMAESYALARQSDPISAFGGIAAFHGRIEAETAMAMTEKGNFLEVVIGTGFSDEALDTFKNRSGWGQDVRLLQAPLPPRKSTLSLKSIRGGAIIQGSDEDSSSEWKVVTDNAPTREQMESLEFQWAVIPHVKSNAIVVGTSNRLLGVGAGQMNRVQSVRLALEQAGDEAKGACLASDAFFPFPDSVETAAKSGIAAIVQPGGSKKDGDVIAKANELGIAMVFTGVRHFRH
ncbi:MAG: bifunctional phosphoribosylaminoimidazolecarboxamide formyltransferase/IMP cyclohydrolase [Fimbriimonadaceae bacterium]|nr:bifunctional phosphoribosylaminoimidazolecarboxamide formyltransferase/IMP cyclohydrolase [Fimbriimonadaceae bacterium]